MLWRAESGFFGGRPEGRIPAVAMKDKLNNEERLRHLTDLLPAGFDPHQAMRVLSEYIRSLEGAFEDYKKSSNSERRQLESEFRNLRKNKDDQKQELDRLTTDLLELTNTLEEQESALGTCNQKIASYEKQFKKVHRENSELANKLTQKENDANFYQQELDRCSRENESLVASLQAANLKIEELERKLAVERETATMHEKEARRVALVLSENQGKMAISERKMEETVLKFNEEIRRLTERSNADAIHEVNLLRKRVRSSVAPEIRDLEKLLGAKLSVETASNFRALYGRLVAKLSQAGLELK